jgi:hypothetical protein
MAYYRLDEARVRMLDLGLTQAGHNNRDPPNKWGNDQ